MSNSVIEFIKDVDSLVSFPAIGARVNEMVNDPNVNMSEIGKAISLDPALTARLLRMANSSAFGVTAKVDSVARAASVIGTRRLRDLVLATSTVSAFEGIPNELVTMENFWRHSLYCAAAARVLAESFDKRNGDTLFIAGLLHDIGQLLIFNQRPQEAKAALLKVLDSGDDLSMHAAEREFIGFDHAQVGGELLRHWNFPDVLVECVEFHHAPEQAKKFPEEVAFIEVANTIAALAEVDSVELEDVPLAERTAWAIIGFTADMLEPAVHAAREKFDEIKDLLKS
jgi:putative nucleotidyltransferase with HDIG domain